MIDSGMVYTLQINEYQRALLAQVAAAFPAQTLANQPNDATLGRKGSFGFGYEPETMADELSALVDMLNNLPNVERDSPGIMHCLHL